MITIKQIEALRWIVELGTFDRAAKRLNTTQSAISKRIQELEVAVGFPIFDRPQRGAKLTDKGEQLLAMGYSILDIHERMLSLRVGGETSPRRLRLGVTELSTLTWFPRLISILREHVPSLALEPDVATSLDLWERLQDDELDLIFIPECFASPDTVAIRLAEVTNVWVAKPGFVKAEGAITLTELSSYPVLVQGRRSGSGRYINRWLKEQGIVFQRSILSDNLTSVLGMTVAGLGVGYLPRQCYEPLLHGGKLVEVPTTPPLPLVPYSAMFKSERSPFLISRVVEIAKETCDFSAQLQV